jgi:hypothetical protein
MGLNLLLVSAGAYAERMAKPVATALAHLEQALAAVQVFSRLAIRWLPNS